MNLIFLLLLPLLLCASGCLSKVAKNADLKTKSDVTSNNLTHLIVNENGNGRAKLKFTDLYEDIYHIIFSFINFNKYPELVHMAAINLKCVDALNSIFRRKYHNYTLRIAYRIPDGFVDHSEFDMRLDIYNYDLAVKTLKYFGNSIRNLEINNGYDGGNHTEDSRIIHRLANEYSKSLIHLDLGQIKGDTFAQFKKPFSAVESLRFRFYFPQTGQMPFDNLLPKLKRLDVVIKDVDISYINCKNLEHVRIFLSCKERKTIEQVAELIKKNPKIKTIETIDFPKYLHDVINEYLPELEAITLNYVGNEVIHFKNVKHLTVSSALTSFNLLDMLKFERLESFEGQISDLKHFRPIYSFFKINRNIRKLNFGIEDTFGRMNNENLQSHLRDLFLELSNLVELKIQFFYRVDTDVIVALSEISKNLTKFEFAVRGYQASTIRTIRQSFEYKWHITEIEPNSQFCYHEGLVLVKKNAALLV